ncbi:MAG TPA: DeoR/GlpR family DNA-binding transcription regulator [Nocardioidaceae bacterium]|nr:DeoR/GlpR family DNA-binding transcription regulator [Nocardioidaceae bacterium]
MTGAGAPERSDPVDVKPSPFRSLGREARQQRITEIVVSRGTVSAQELAETFAVSVMTVHRDLDELQRRGVLRKSRGAATAQPSGIFESNVEYRSKANLEDKQAIARYACGHVEPGMSVLLDDSTTALQMVPGLAALAPLTVATNYLTAMTALAQHRDIDLVGLGGQYDVRHSSFLGNMCSETVRSLRFDVAFVSTSAVMNGHAFHQEDRIVSVKREMVGVAGRAYLLLDHSKLRRTALHRLLPLHDFTAVIVDAGTSPAQLAELEEHDVRVEVAGEVGRGR